MCKKRVDEGGGGGLQYCSYQEIMVIKLFKMFFFCFTRFI